MSEREPIAQDTAKGPPETDPRIEGEKHPVARMIGIGVLASLIGIAICLLIDWFPTRRVERRATTSTRSTTSC